MLHIGKEIEKRAKEIKVGSTELARLINTTKQNVHRIYKSKSIDTEQLDAISRALKFNFFFLYTEGLEASLVEEPLISNLQRSEKSINSKATLYAGLQVIVIKKDGHAIGQLMANKDALTLRVRFIELAPQIYLSDVSKKEEFRKAIEAGKEQQFRLAFFKRIDVKDIIDIHILDEDLQSDSLVD